MNRSKQTGIAHINYGFLNFQQLNNMIKKYSTKLNDANLDGLNDKRKLFRLENKKSDYSRLLNFIGKYILLLIS